MVEIRLIRKYLVVKETLERIGIANRETKVITPSCYIIYDDDDKYYITHFKNLLAKNSNKPIPQKDIDRQNAICTMLQNWGSIEIVNEEGIYQEELKEKIFVLKYDEKQNYQINHKIKIGD